MPSEMKDGLRGKRITGVLRKKDKYWQPLKKTTDEGERNQKGDINIYEWSSGMIRSHCSYNFLIKSTLEKANHLQEKGYYIVDIYSDTSRPLYDINWNSEPNARTVFTILYRAYLPSELTIESKNYRQHGDVP